MSDDRPRYRFRADLWLYGGAATWYFVTLPHAITDEIDDLTVATRRGFGSVRVEVTVGSTTWRTSVFPDTKAASYVLPVKRAVRLAEGLVDGEPVDVELVLVDDEDA